MLIIYNHFPKSREREDGRETLDFWDWKGVPVTHLALNSYIQEPILYVLFCLVLTGLMTNCLQIITLDWRITKAYWRQGDVASASSPYWKTKLVRHSRLWICLSLWWVQWLGLAWLGGDASQAQVRSVHRKPLKVMSHYKEYGLNNAWLELRPNSLSSVISHWSF